MRPLTGFGVAVATKKINCGQLWYNVENGKFKIICSYYPHGLFRIINGFSSDITNDDKESFKKGVG